MKSMDDRSLLQITNLFELEAGLYVTEIRNNMEFTYDYYLVKNDFPLSHLFGVPVDERFSADRLKERYQNGDFDAQIEKEFNR